MEDSNKGDTFQVSRWDFFHEWRKYPKESKVKKLYDYFVCRFNLNRAELCIKDFQNQIKLHCLSLERKWDAAGRRELRFIDKYKKWLDSNEIFSINTTEKSTTWELPSTSTCQGGRPYKDFSDCGHKTKKQKVSNILNQHSGEEIAFAAEVKLHQEGRRTVAKILKNVVESPVTASRKEIVKSLESEKSEQKERKLLPDEALAYYIDAKLTAHSYKLTRKKALEAGHNLYPSYNELRKAKSDCLPVDSSIMVDEISASIELQKLLDLTAERIFVSQRPVINTYINANTTLTLICKWGIDGSGNHSIYKQKFSESSMTDEYLLFISFVPVQLLDKASEKVIWQNPRTSSTRFCRPIKLVFEKETTDLIKRETNHINYQISNLRNFIYNVTEATEIQIQYDLKATMIDGKVCNALADNASTQTCYICGAKSSEMNNDTSNQEIKSEYLSFGLSPLHALIRLFECMLHIGYRIDIKNWQVRGEANKEIVKKRKLEIQKNFREELGLVVDKPKPGFGSSNDGNTARVFFKNYEKSSIILGVDNDLIKKLWIILSVIASEYKIDIDNFEKFLSETRELYLKLYSWYKMPPTLHKILCHGAEVIKHCILPIGMMSEEAQEARNKDLRRFRERHTRKMTRKLTNMDLVTMLMITSDPIINMYRDLPKKSLITLNPEAKKFLISPCIPKSTNTDSVSTTVENMEVLSNSSQSDSDFQSN